MKVITQRESFVTYIKSCLIFQIPRFMLICKYRVISPLRAQTKQKRTILMPVLDILSYIIAKEVYLLLLTLN